VNKRDAHAVDKSTILIELLKVVRGYVKRALEVKEHHSYLRIRESEENVP